MSDPVAQSIIASGLPNPARNPRQVFVAYPYTLYDTTDYRRPFKDLAKAFDVKFVFAHSVYGQGSDPLALRSSWKR